MPPFASDQASAGRNGGDNPAKKHSRTWLRARARLAPNLLSQSPPWVRSVFEHAWAPMETLARQLDCLPPALYDYLLTHKGGFTVICPAESGYKPGPATIRQQQVQNVALISIGDLAHNNERPLHVLAHLVDHYLGCGGDADGPWLSDGGGETPRWQEAGARLPSLFTLGYAVDATAGANVRDYFAQSLAFYCRDRQHLNIADPQIYKWFRTTLWDDDFWRTKE